MVCSVHSLRFLHRAMIKPENDIAISVESRSSDGDRIVCFAGENGQGASSIKSNAFDPVDIDIVLADCSLYRERDATPNIGG